MAMKKKTLEDSSDDIEVVELEAEVTDRVLEETPARVSRFVLGVAALSEARARLRARGYSNIVAREAWNHLDALAGFDAKESPAEEQAPSEDDAKVLKATAAIDAWDEPGFRLMRATLKRAFADQYKYVFAGDVQATKGPMSVVGVRRVIHRLNDLESSPERKETRKQDHAALARLAERGIDKAERTRIEALLTIVGTLGDAEAPEPSEAEAAIRRNHLVKLREWFEEWSEVAKVAIKRRDHLIRLGLAHRRVPNEGSGGGGTLV